MAKGRVKRIVKKVKEVITPAVANAENIIRGKELKTKDSMIKTSKGAVPEKG